MAELAPVHQQVLRAQPMHGDEPGTVLRAVETLLAFMGDNTPTVSAKHHLLPMGTLAPLNAQMTHPMQLSLQRPQQRASAHIHALYLLLRATGLASITGTGNNPRLALDEDGLASWRHRNPTERYLTRVETWLRRAQPESIAERLGSCRSPLADWAGFCRRIPDNDRRIAGNQREEERLVYVPGHLTVALFELFGFVTVHHGTPEPDTGWRIIEIHRRPWGDALFHLVSEALQRVDVLVQLDTEAGTECGDWQALIQPSCPAWRDNLRLSEHALQDGTSLFNVSLGRVWRRLAVQGRHDGDTLSDGMLDTFECDDDHLDKFAYQSHFGTLISMHHPTLDEPPLTSEVRIGEVPLRLGTSMTYLYDFGGRWACDVRLERIDPVDRTMRKVRMLDAYGEAPEPYPGADDREA